MAWNWTCWLQLLCHISLIRLAEDVLDETYGLLAIDVIHKILYRYNISLSFCVLQWIMRSVQVLPVDIFPNTPQLIRFQLAPRLVERAAFVHFYHFLWIYEEFQSIRKE